MMLTSPTKDTRFHSNGFASIGQPVANPTATNPNAGTKRLASCREELELSWGDHSYLRCVSNDGDSPESHRRAKRRKSCMLEDSCMAEHAFVEGKRISPWSGEIQQQAKARPQVKAGWYTGEVDVLGNRHGKGTTKHDDCTEYEGAYAEDFMDGPWGCYKFLTTQRLVPNPHQNGSNLHRQTEKSFEGSFKNDQPHGPGTLITKTVDCAPQVLGLAPVFMEVMHDTGMHMGQAVGEGVRIVYTTTNDGSRSTLQKTCFRLMHGENTNLQVAPAYASWMLKCMNLKFPPPPSSI